MDRPGPCWVSHAPDWSLGCSCFIAPKSLTGCEHDALPAGDAEFETCRDPLRPLGEMCGRHGRADLVRCGLEQFEPAIEMCGVDGELHVHDHRCSLIAARHQRHRRPECAHLLQMWLP